MNACPVCGDAARRELYADLEDRLFGSAGRWSLQACAVCGSAYLDPRPTRRELDRAYAVYYTHETPVLSVRSMPRRALKNGYLNATLDYRLRPAARFARIWLAPFPLRRRAIRLAIRDLRLPREPAPLLLDVGCGNGAFLLDARAAGWSVEGIDPDPTAVRAAADAGLRVHAETVETAELGAGQYDAITLHHVIEHLADPRAALERCREWLKPDGSLWIATPNIDAPGRAEYGPAWRGLDVPRHLVLFSAGSLRALLESAGFGAVRFLPPARSLWIYEASESLRDRRKRRSALRVRSLLRDLRCLRGPTRGEELVVLAR